MRKGLTFLELLMVVVLLGLFVAMATPRFQSTYFALQLSNQAKGLAKFLTYAQERAVLEGKTYRFAIDPDKRRYWLEAESEEEDSSFKRIEGRYGRIFELPEGIFLESEAKEIFFYPDGGSDPFTLSLNTKEGNTLLLKSGKPFGHVRIEEPSPPS